MAKKPEVPADETPPPMSKTAAVRAAIAEGVDKPSDGVSYVKEKFGVDITAQYFSIIKSQTKLKVGKKTSRTRKPAIASAPTIPSTASSNGKHNVATSLASIKKLVDELGVDQVKEIAEMLR
jgi:hypothetical protein